MYYVAPETPMMSSVIADCPDLVPPKYFGQVYASARHRQLHCHPSLDTIKKVLANQSIEDARWPHLVATRNAEFHCIFVSYLSNSIALLTA